MTGRQFGPLGGLGLIDHGLRATPKRLGQEPLRLSISLVGQCLHLGEPSQTHIALVCILSV